MVDWKQHELELIARYEPIFKLGGRSAMFESIPEQQRRYKCYTCYAILNHSDLVDGKKCPDCGETHLIDMCPLDVLPSSEDFCHHEVEPGLQYCPICGDAICPVCGKTHNVQTLSRVTGYLASTDGWNAGKIAELSDRQRYNIMV